MVRDAPLVPLTASDRIAYAACSIRDGLRLLLWPSPLRASYGNYEPQAVWLGVLVLMAAAVLAVALRKRHPLVGLGFVWFAVTSLPSTRLLTDSSVAIAFAERYLYLPSAGMAVLVSAGILESDGRWGKILRPGMFALAVILAVGTHQRCALWHDEVRLWKTDTAVDPSNGDAWMQLGYELGLSRREGETQADHAARKAELRRLREDQLQDRPGFWQFANTCGAAYREANRMAEAERAHLQPERQTQGTNVRFNYGVMLARQGRMAEAIDRFQWAMDQEATPAMREVRRGQMLFFCFPERREEACEAFASALRIAPEFSPALSWRGRAGCRSETGGHADELRDEGGARMAAGVVQSEEQHGRHAGQRADRSGTRGGHLLVRQAGAGAHERGHAHDPRTALRGTVFVDRQDANSDSGLGGRRAASEHQVLGSVAA